MTLDTVIHLSCSFITAGVEYLTESEKLPYHQQGKLKLAFG